MIVQSIIFAVFISGSLLGSVYLNKQFEDLLPAHLMVTMLILYMCGLISKLESGVYVILLLTAISYIASIVGVIKKKNISSVAKKLFTPAFFIFTLMFCVFTYTDMGMMAHSWDEFSHWVDSVKGMTYVNDFVTNPKAASAFQSYPPAMALMQYLVSRIYLMVNRGSEFNEWRVYFVFQVFSTSMFMPLLSNETFRNPVKAICHALVLLFLPLFFYNNFWTAVYIDPFISTLAGTAFCFILLKNEDDKLQFIYICLLCATLILSKDVGLYFAFFIAVVYITKNIIENERELTIKTCLRAIAPFIVSVIIKWTWNHEISTAGAHVSFGGKIDLFHYTRMFFFHDDVTYHQEVVDNFKHAFFRQNIALGIWGSTISYFSLFILFVIGAALLLRLQGREGDENRKLSNKICILIVLFSVILYTYGLGATYVSNFTEYEAVRLASYSRYMNIAYLMIAIVIVEGIYHYSGIFEKSRLVNIILAAAIFAVSPMGTVKDFLCRETVRTSQSVRSSYEPLHQLIIRNCSREGKDKIYCISEADEGFDFWVTRFNSRPNGFSKNFTWSLGEPQFEGDIWTNNSIATADDWMRILDEGEYTYIAIYDVNDYFREHFSAVFSNPSDINNNTLFRRDPATGLFIKCD